jgi:hypothetical protein
MGAGPLFYCLFSCSLVVQALCLSKTAVKTRFAFLELVCAEDERDHRCWRDDDEERGGPTSRPVRRRRMAQEAPPARARGDQGLPHASNDAAIVDAAAARGVKGCILPPQMGDESQSTGAVCYAPASQESASLPRCSSTQQGGCRQTGVVSA